jgi:hypothetical protein
MGVRILIVDNDSVHANACKFAINSGYGSDISANIAIVADLATAISIATSNTDVVAILRSYTGVAAAVSLLAPLYPRVLGFFPMGSNTYEELSIFTEQEPPVIVTTGAGDTENQNNTAWGNGLEFWDNDLTDVDPADLSSYSNAVILGKLLRIKDNLECDWWEARYRARTTALQTEDTRFNKGWDIRNGYGKIVEWNALHYKGVIPLDPYLITYTEEEILQAFEDIDTFITPYFDNTNIRIGFEDTGNAETEDVESSRISSFSFEDGIVNCKLKLYTDADTFTKDNTAYIAKIDGNENLITLNNFLYNWVKNNTSRLNNSTFKTQTK